MSEANNAQQRIPISRGVIIVATLVIVAVVLLFTSMAIDVITPEPTSTPTPTPTATLTSTLTPTLTPTPTLTLTPTPTATLISGDCYGILIGDRVAQYTNYATDTDAYFEQRMNVPYLQSGLLVQVAQHCVRDFEVYEIFPIDPSALVILLLIRG